MNKMTIEKKKELMMQVLLLSFIKKDIENSERVLIETQNDENRNAEKLDRWNEYLAPKFEAFVHMMKDVIANDKLNPEGLSCNIEGFKAMTLDNYVDTFEHNMELIRSAKECAELISEIHDYGFESLKEGN